MATAIKEYLKSKFETGDKPTQSDFQSLIEALPSESAPNGFVVISPVGSGDYLTINEAVSAGKYQLYLEEGTHTLTDHITLDADYIDPRLPICILGCSKEHTILDFDIYSIHIKDSDVLHLDDLVGETLVTSSNKQIIFTWSDSINAYNLFNSLSGETDLENYYLLPAQTNSSFPHQIKSIELSGNTPLSGNAIINLNTAYVGPPSTNEASITMHLTEAFTNFSMKNLYITRLVADYSGDECIEFSGYSSMLISPRFDNLIIDLDNDRFVYDSSGSFWKFDNIVLLGTRQIYAPVYSVFYNSYLENIDDNIKVTYKNCIINNDSINGMSYFEYCTFTNRTKNEIFAGLDVNNNKSFISCYDRNGEQFSSPTYYERRFNQNKFDYPVIKCLLNLYQSSSYGIFNGGPPTVLNSKVALIDKSQFEIKDLYLTDATGNRVSYPYVALDWSLFGTILTPTTSASDGDGNTTFIFDGVDFTPYYSFGFSFIYLWSATATNTLRQIAAFIKYNATLGMTGISISDEDFPLISNPSYPLIIYPIFGQGTNSTGSIDLFPYVSTLKAEIIITPTIEIYNIPTVVD